MKTNIIYLNKILSKKAVEVKIDNGEKTDKENEYQKVLQELGTTLQKGGVVAFPTETVYGLGANALDSEAASKIYEAKGRPSDNPLIVHVATKKDVELITKNITPEAKKMMKEFWPGPLTLVLHKKDIVPLGTTGGLDTVAVRMPKHKLARDIIKAGGGYIAAPSANISGRPSPTLGKHVVEDMDGRIDAIVVRDNVRIGVESTIVDCTVEPPMILRPGAVTQGMIEELVCKIEVDKTLMKSGTSEAPRAPGMKYRHYAPKADMTIVDGVLEDRVNYIKGEVKQHLKKGKKVAVIVLGDTMEKYGLQFITEENHLCELQIQCLATEMNPQEASKNLYRILRHMDTLGVDYIYCEEVPANDAWLAVRNRLHKAAGNNIIKGDKL